MLRGLLKNGNHVTFYSKPSFVDPRPCVSDLESLNQFRFVDCTNEKTDYLHKKFAPGGTGIWRQFWGTVNATSYNRGLVRAMRQGNAGEVDLWLGDWARGKSNRPTVSFVQGAPASDARSISRHRELIEKLAGRSRYLKLAAYAWWRAGPGMKPMHFSDHVIVGSQWSRRKLIDSYGLKPANVHAIPYPMDLNLFSSIGRDRPPSGRLRLFWLGRFVPRKRLDLFLDGLAIAIKNGCDVEAWVVGQSWDWFVPNFERLIHEFPYPDRIRHWPSVTREQVSAMFTEVDVMAQPSDEEDFGSSVAESLACGVPAIVGATNGTGDYICERSIRLVDDKPETMAAAIKSMANAKRQGDLVDAAPSRQTAEKFFSPVNVTNSLEAVLALAVQ